MMKAHSRAPLWFNTLRAKTQSLGRARMSNPSLLVDSARANNLIGDHLKPCDWPVGLGPLQPRQTHLACAVRRSESSVEH